MAVTSFYHLRIFFFTQKNLKIGNRTGRIWMNKTNDKDMIYYVSDDSMEEFEKYFISIHVSNYCLVGVWCPVWFYHLLSKRETTSNAVWIESFWSQPKCWA